MPLTPLIVEITLGALILAAGAVLFALGSARLAWSFKRFQGASPCIAAQWLFAAPVTVIALQSATGGSPAMALGTLVGAVLFLLLAAAGASAITGRLSLPKQPKAMGRALLAAGILLLVLCMDGALTRGDGLLLLLAAAGWHFYRRRRVTPPVEAPPRPRCTSWCAAAYCFTGLALLVTGGNLLADGALWITITRETPEAVVAAVLVAALACLPGSAGYARLATQGRPDVAERMLGNALFLMLAASGLCALLTPMPVPPALLAAGLPALAAAAAAWAGLLLAGRTPPQRTGMLWLALWLAYALYQYGLL